MDYPARGTFDDTMSEISGFGGGYEDACRTMLRAGVAWIDEHPNADLVVMESPHIFGLVKEESDDAKALSDAICAPVPGCSGAMHHAVIRSVLFIHKRGWKAYVDRMRQSEKETG